MAQIPDARPHATRNLENQISTLLHRLTQEASAAVAMLESALAALWVLDVEAAAEVRLRDKSIDQEEVRIEREALRIMALEQPVARDLRYIAFVLKANADVERVADHSKSIAKVVRLMGQGATSQDPAPKWPTSLIELGQRVPMLCHALLRAMHDEDAVAARAIVAQDKQIDDLEKQLFEETVALVRDNEEDIEQGILIYRIGRELERIADLMTNIAEDIIYVTTGEIVRHEVKKKSAN
jgi:phosphate transport system protein